MSYKLPANSVPNGGTGDSSFTAYAPVCGGTTTTGPLQSASTNQSSTGFVLTRTGASSLPTFQQVPLTAFGNFIETGTQVASNYTAVLVPFMGVNPGSTFGSSAALSNSLMFLLPIYVDLSKTYVAVGAKVISSPGAGSTFDVLIYDSSGTGNLPGNLLTSATGISSAATGVTEGTISQALSIGWYWIGVQRNSTGAVALAGAANGDNCSILTNKAFVNLSNLSSTFYETISLFGSTNTYGTYVNNPSITNNQPINAVPMIYLR